MRGCQIKLSEELILEYLGLNEPGIKIDSIFVETFSPATIILTLKGDNKKLPEIKEGELYPKAVIDFSYIESNIRVIT